MYSIGSALSSTRVQSHLQNELYLAISHRVRGIRHRCVLQSVQSMLGNCGFFVLKYR